MFSLAGAVTVGAGRMVEQRTGRFHVRATIRVGTVDALGLVPACHFDTGKTRADYDNCRIVSVEHLATRVGARAQHDRCASKTPRKKKASHIRRRTKPVAVQWQ